MRFGGPTFREVNDPEAWIAELKRLNYSATYWLSVDDKDEALAGAFEFCKTGRYCDCGSSHF